MSLLLYSSGPPPNIANVTASFYLSGSVTAVCAAGSSASAAIALGVAVSGVVAAPSSLEAELPLSSSMSGVIGCAGSGVGEFSPASGASFAVAAAAGISSQFGVSGFAGLVAGVGAFVTGYIVPQVSVSAVVATAAEVVVTGVFSLEGGGECVAGTGMSGAGVLNSRLYGRAAVGCAVVIMDEFQFAKPTEGKPSMSVVTFTCKDQDGAALPGVYTVILNSRGGITASGVSKADGTYQVTLESGPFVAAFKKAGVATPKTKVLQIVEPSVDVAVDCKVLDISMAAPVLRSCRVHGMVVGPDGAPIATAVHLVIEPPNGRLGAGVVGAVAPLVLEADETGYWETDVIVGSRVSMWVPVSGLQRDFLVPDKEEVTPDEAPVCKPKEVVWA